MLYNAHKKKFLEHQQEEVALEVEDDLLLALSIDDKTAMQS
jgi:hypothetical protein